MLIQFLASVLKCNFFPHAVVVICVYQSTIHAAPRQILLSKLSTKLNPFNFVPRFMQAVTEFGITFCLVNKALGSSSTCGTLPFLGLLISILDLPCNDIVESVMIIFLGLLSPPTNYSYTELPIALFCLP